MKKMVNLTIKFCTSSSRYICMAINGTHTGGAEQGARNCFLFLSNFHWRSWKMMMMQQQQDQDRFQTFVLLWSGLGWKICSHRCDLMHIIVYSCCEFILYSLSIIADFTGLLSVFYLASKKKRQCSFPSFSMARMSTNLGSVMYLWMCEEIPRKERPFLASLDSSLQW